MPVPNEPRPCQAPLNRKLSVRMATPRISCTGQWFTRGPRFRGDDSWSSLERLVQTAVGWAADHRPRRRTPLPPLTCPLSAATTAVFAFRERACSTRPTTRPPSSRASMTPGRRPVPSRPARARSRARKPYLDRHPAAERHRLAPHGPRAQQHAPGHPRPLRAHARPRRALAAGHRPRRHRHPDGGRAPDDGAAGAEPPRDRPREIPREGLGVEGGVGRR